MFGGDDAGIIGNLFAVLERHVEPTDANVDDVRARLRAWGIGTVKSQRGAR